MSRGHFSRESNALDLNKSGNTSYERYKANLHAIFDGKAPLPTGLRELAGVGAAAPVEQTKEDVIEVTPLAKSSRRRSAVQSPYSLFTEALKRASTHDEMQHAVAAFKEAKHEFPSDEDLLSKVLTHPDEDIVLEVLCHLEALFAAQPPKNSRLLVTRLEDAAFLSKPGAAKDRILKMKAKYRA
jgi:hypothetical protein